MSEPAATPSWSSRADVLDHVGPGVTAADLAPYVDAAVGAVADLRPDLDLSDPETVTPQVRMAVALLTKRLYARRDAALGIATFGDFGPTYVARSDTDVARLLGVGIYGVPVL